MDSRRGPFLALLVAALAVPSAAQAAVRCVPVTGPGCTSSHATIAAAVTAAAPTGDTIKIAAGTYGESISTTKSLSFVGAGAGTLGSAAGATVIAPPSGSAFNLSRGGSLRALRAVGATSFSRLQRPDPAARRRRHLRLHRERRDRRRRRRHRLHVRGGRRRAVGREQLGRPDRQPLAQRRRLPRRRVDQLHPGHRARAQRTRPLRLPQQHQRGRSGEPGRRRLSRPGAARPST